DAGHQEVDVADAGYPDGATEHVAEHQHEDHGLHRREHDGGRHTHQRDEVAAGDGQHVADDGGDGDPDVGIVGDAGFVGDRQSDCGHAAPLVAGADSSVSVASSPVSCRKTSSSVGWRTLTALGARSTDSSRRTTSSSARPLSVTPIDTAASASNSSVGPTAASWRAAMRARRTVGKRTSTNVVPSVCLSSAADPSAMTRPWSTTTMWSA